MSGKWFGKFREFDWQRVIPLLVAFLCFCYIYFPLFAAPQLAWDDEHNIFRNPFFVTGDWLRIWREPYFGLYVPLVNTIWALLFHFGEGSPLPYRLLNFFLHATNTFLFWRILLVFCQRYHLRSVTAQLLAVAVFAIHPLQVGAFAWLSGARDLLSVCFSFVAILSWLRWPDRKGAVLASVFFILAMLSKPQVAALPLAVMVFQYFTGDRRRSVFLLLGSWCCFAIGIAVFTLSIQDADMRFQSPLWLRPAIALDAFGFYLHKFIWPTSLTIDYGRSPQWLAQHLDAVNMTGPATFAFLVGTFFLSWIEPFAIVGWLAFVVILPVSGVVSFGFQQYSTVADHYFYFSMAALACQVLVVADWFARKRPRLAMVVAVPIVGAMVTGSSLRAAEWVGSEPLFQSAIEVRSDSFFGNMGMAMIECRKGVARVDWGIEHATKALRERPHDLVAVGQYLNCQFNKGDYAVVYQRRSLLREQEEIAGLRTNQVTAAAIFALTAAAAFNLGEKEDAFQFACQAYWRNGIEPFVFGVFQRVLNDFADRGQPRTCPEREDVESFLNRTVPLR